VGLLGREGMVGMSALMGALSVPFHSFIQVAGTGFKIKIEFVAREFDRSAKFRQKLLLFFQAHLIQTSQIAACIRRHDVGQTSGALAAQLPGPQRFGHDRTDA
jgi:hypothetical protein